MLSNSSKVAAQYSVWRVPLNDAVFGRRWGTYRRPYYTTFEQLQTRSHDPAGQPLRLPYGNEQDLQDTLSMSPQSWGQIPLRAPSLSRPSIRKRACDQASLVSDV